MEKIFKNVFVYHNKKPFPFNHQYLYETLDELHDQPRDTAIDDEDPHFGMGGGGGDDLRCQRALLLAKWRSIPAGHSHPRQPQS